MIELPSAMQLNRVLVIELWWKNVVSICHRVREGKRIELMRKTFPIVEMPKISWILLLLLLQLLKDKVDLIICDNSRTNWIAIDRNVRELPSKLAWPLHGAVQR